MVMTYAGDPDRVSSKTQKWHSAFVDKKVLGSDPDCLFSTMTCLTHFPLTTYIFPGPLCYMFNVVFSRSLSSQDQLETLTRLCTEA